MKPQDILKSWIEKDPLFHKYLHSIIDGICDNNKIYYDVNKQENTFILKRVMIYKVDDTSLNFDTYDYIRNGWITSFPAKIVTYYVERGRLVHNKNGKLIKFNNLDVPDPLSSENAIILQENKMCVQNNVIHLLFDLKDFFDIVNYHPFFRNKQNRLENPFSNLTIQEQSMLKKY